MLLLDCLRNAPEDPDSLLFHNAQYSEKMKHFLTESVLETNNHNADGLLSVRDKGPWLEVS
jgi:hypothetical protein